MSSPAQAQTPGRRRLLFVSGLLVFVILILFLVLKSPPRSPERPVSLPKPIDASPTPIAESQAAPEPPKPELAVQPERAKTQDELTWKTLPRIVRFRNPMADSEGGSKRHEERVLLEDGLTREEFSKAQAFIKGIDRQLDEVFGALPLFAQHAGGDAKGGPDSQIRMLMSAALGNESIEGVDPAALRVRAICRLACYERNEDSLGKLTALAGGDADPDVQVAAAVTMAIWKAEASVVPWIKSQSNEEAVSAFIGALQFPSIESTQLEGNTYLERLRPRFGVGLAQALVEARQASSDPLLRQRALSTLGLCAYEGRSREAIEELFREAEASASPKTQAFAFRGLNNALELDTTRNRLAQWAAGSNERLAGLSIMTLGMQLHTDSVKALGELLISSQGQRAQAIIHALAKAKGSMAPLALAELELTSQRHTEEAIRILASEKLEAIRKRLDSTRRK